MRGAAALIVAVVAASVLHAQAPKHSLYVAAPVEDADPNRALRLLVFDIDNAHRFIRRIDLRTSNTADKLESVRFVATRPQSGRLFLSTSRRLVAVDLKTNAVVWDRSYEEHCCDRFALSPDGQTIYAPAFGSPKWYVIAASNGELRATINVQGWPRETFITPDGRRAVLASWDTETLPVIDTASGKVIVNAGPFGGYLCPMTTNAKVTMAFANVDNFVGFEVADLQTGQILDSVAVEDITRDEAAQYECPSHGIAFTPDQRELWLADGVRNRLHVFDATVYPPVASLSIDLARQPRWITFSSDGRYAYASTGDVIDAREKKIIGALRDAGGAIVNAERAMEIDTP